tara:strand:+ start:647 stop:2089 length:1443 start_codon:yes stop_codon:yes gene_type:complete
MSERQIPSTIDYSQVLPLSVPAIAKRHKFYAANGGVFTWAGNNEIRIPVDSVNALCDPAHSYLEFAVQNVGGQTFGPDIGGAYNFFTECRIEQGGRVLSRIQELNRLYAAVLNPCQESSEGVSTEGILGSRRSYTNNAAASLVPAAAGSTSDVYSLARHNNQAYFGAATHRFTMPLPTGLFNQDKLIPLPLVDNNSPITIVLTLANPQNVGCWNGIPNANDLQVFETTYNAQLIEVGNDVIEQFRGVQDMFGGQLVLSGQDWEYSASNIAAGANGTVDLRLPVRKRSIKSVFWIAQSDDYGNTGGLGPSTTYNLSFSGQANVDSWNLKFGSVVFPSTPVRAMGNSAVAGAPFRRGESVMELAKAFGTLGFENPTGTLSTTSYCTDSVGMGDGDMGVGGAPRVPISNEPVSVCPNGISTEAFARSITESGVDVETLAQETFLTLNWANGVNSGIEAKVIHTWVLYDQHYYFNRDGSITFSN